MTSVSSFRLVITFEGLCGFVPFRGQGSAIKSMWVLMPDRTQGPVGKNLPPVHTPVMRCNTRDLVPSVPVEYAMCHWRLAGYDIRILPGGKAVAQDALVFRAYDPVTDKNTGTGSSYNQSFAWIAPMEAACQGVGYPGGGYVRPEFVKPKIPASIAGLAARLFVNLGEVYVSAIGAYPDKTATEHPVLWRFRAFRGRPSKKNLVVLVASQIILEMTINASYVDLTTTGFDGTSGPSLRLAPPVASDPTVRVSMLNEESDAIVPAFEKPAAMQMGRARVRDRIYEAFFDLAQDVKMPGSKRPIPVPSRLQPLSTSSGGGVTIPTVVSPPCSPGRYPAA